MWESRIGTPVSGAERAFQTRSSRARFDKLNGLTLPFVELVETNYAL